LVSVPHGDAPARRIDAEVHCAEVVDRAPDRRFGASEVGDVAGIEAVSPPIAAATSSLETGRSRIATRALAHQHLGGRTRHSGCSADDDCLPR
jgi:hypothetical protein